MTRMRGFDFVVRTPDGHVRVVTFYERTRPAALTLARAWAKRTGHELLGAQEDEAA